MEDFDSILDKVKSELDMLENKGIIALPHFFQEQGIKAIRGNDRQCVISRYLQTLFPEDHLWFSTGLSYKRDTKVRQVGDIISIQLGHDSELNCLASNFDSGHYPELDQDRSIIHD